MSDNISRQGLLLQIEKDADGSPGWYGDTWQFIKTIKSMPSTDRKGHWIDNDKSGTFKIWECSECGISMEAQWNFCPHCGADMRGDKNE